MVNKWKVIAIIFIILFILETGLFIWAVKNGIDIEESEFECAYNVCNEHSSYAYDYTDRMCYCYKDGEIDKSEYIK